MEEDINFKLPTIPSYEGERSAATVYGFINQAKQIVSMYKCEEETKVKLTLCALKGDATLFATQFAKQHDAEEMTMERFTDEFLLKFLPPNHRESFIEEYENIQQTGSVSDYSLHFGKVVDQLPEGYASSMQKLGRFVHGFKAQIRVEVLMRQASTLHEAMRTAQLYDEIQRPKRSFTQGFLPYRNQDDSTGSTETFGRGFERTRLNQVQKEALKCFNCQRYGHVQRQCPSHRTKAKIW